jgi:hypothetical protein
MEDLAPLISSAQGVWKGMCVVVYLSLFQHAMQCAHIHAVAHYNTCVITTIKHIHSHNESHLTQQALNTHHASRTQRNTQTQHADAIKHQTQYAIEHNMQTLNTLHQASSNTIINIATIAHMCIN